MADFDASLLAQVRQQRRCRFREACLPAKWSCMVRGAAAWVCACRVRLDLDCLLTRGEESVHHSRYTLFLQHTRQHTGSHDVLHTSPASCNDAVSSS